MCFSALNISSSLESSLAFRRTDDLRVRFSDAAEAFCLKIHEAFRRETNKYRRNGFYLESAFSRCQEMFVFRTAVRRRCGMLLLNKFCRASESRNGLNLSVRPSDNTSPCKISFILQVVLCGHFYLWRLEVKLTLLSQSPGTFWSFFILWFDDTDTLKHSLCSLQISKRLPLFYKPFCNVFFEHDTRKRIWRSIHFLYISE